MANIMSARIPAQRTEVGELDARWRMPDTGDIVGGGIFSLVVFVEEVMRGSEGGDFCTPNRVPHDRPKIGDLCTVSRAHFPCFQGNPRPRSDKNRRIDLNCLKMRRMR
jgi:hypothetical protein